MSVIEYDDHKREHSFEPQWEDGDSISVKFCNRWCPATVVRTMRTIHGTPRLIYRLEERVERVIGPRGGIFFWRKPDVVTYDIGHEQEITPRLEANIKPRI